MHIDFISTMQPTLFTLYIRNMKPACVVFFTDGLTTGGSTSAKSVDECGKVQFILDKETNQPVKI